MTCTKSWPQSAVGSKLLMKLYRMKQSKGNHSAVSNRVLALGSRMQSWALLRVRTCGGDAVVGDGCGLRCGFALLKCMVCRRDMGSVWTCAYISGNNCSPGCILVMYGNRETRRRIFVTRRVVVRTNVNTKNMVATTFSPCLFQTPAADESPIQGTKPLTVPSPGLVRSSPCSEQRGGHN